MTYNPPQHVMLEVGLEEAFKDLIRNFCSRDAKKQEIKKEDIKPELFDQKDLVL